RDLSKDSITYNPVDLTSKLARSSSKILRRAVESGGVILGIKIPKMKGLLGFELMPGRRFGTELADYARFWAGVSGIIHSDELPGYGITGEEVNVVYETLNADPSIDAFIIVADIREKALKALSTIVDRIRVAFDGVPEETRAANEDGTTRYMRPRPGAARMYPETDIPPVKVTDELISEADKIKPEPLNVKLERLISKYGLSRELALEVLMDIRLDLIESLIEKYHERVQPSIIASIFVVTLRGLRGKGLDIEIITDKHLEEIVSYIAEGLIAKEASELILEEIAKNPQLTVREAIEKLGLRAVSEAEAEAVIDEIIREYIEEVKKRGLKATSLIIGKAMGKLRGKIDGRRVAEIAREKIEKIIGEHKT
ncbi:MAG: GAD domain-containing protein, partial [Acidilobaceae archaeon]